MMRSLLVFIVLLVITGLFLEFWTSSPERFFKPKATTTQTPKASVYMRNTETRLFNQVGQLEYRLTSEETQYFDNAKRFDLQQPKLRSYSVGQAPWHLTAQRGQVTQKDNRVLLTGNVHIWQPLDSGGKREINTTSLTFFPEKKYAETDKRVTLSSPSEWLTGVGMQAWFSDKRYKLLAKVEGSAQ